MLSEEILDLATHGVVATVATRDDKLAPESTEAVAIRFLNQGALLEVFLVHHWFGKTIANAQGNGRIAVTFSRPTDFKSSQVKGLFRGIRPATPEDCQFASSFSVLKKNEYLASGTSKESVNSLKCAPTHVMEVEVTDVFLQTPGPKAGERIK